MQKILVVDDEPDAVDMLTAFLSQRGYAITAAFNGEEGIRKFNEEKPDLVMLDIKMPKKDGFQFLRELRSTKDWVPVVITSALTEPVNILKGYGLEADYYITKPINLEDVLKAVKIMLSLAPLRRK